MHAALILRSSVDRGTSELSLASSRQDTALMIAAEQGCSSVLRSCWPKQGTLHTVACLVWQTAVAGTSTNVGDSRTPERVSGTRGLRAPGGYFLLQGKSSRPTAYGS